MIFALMLFQTVLGISYKWLTETCGHVLRSVSSFGWSTSFAQSLLLGNSASAYPRPLTFWMMLRRLGQRLGPYITMSRTNLALRLAFSTSSSFCFFNVTLASHRNKAVAC